MKDAGLSGHELAVRCGWHRAKSSPIARGITPPEFQDRGWRLEPGGKRVSFEATCANRDHLWTGNLTVEGLAPERVAERPSLYHA
ncbi:hypothetical protein [Streptomyces antimicrobicus]|uniref:hypothetical protein n=1 Tax=Streptomyces antimicrobicus TaxID=2883108 RepID=UPI0035AB8870